MKFITEIRSILAKHNYLCTITKLFENPTKKNRCVAISLTLPYNKSKILYDCILKYKRGCCDISTQLQIISPDIRPDIVDYVYENVPVYAGGVLLYSIITGLIIQSKYNLLLPLLVQEDIEIVDNENILDFFKLSNNKTDSEKYYELINILKEVSRNGFTKTVDNLAKNSPKDIMAGYNFIKSNA